MSPLSKKYTIFPSRRIWWTNNVHSLWSKFFFESSSWPLLVDFLGLTGVEVSTGLWILSLSKRSGTALCTRFAPSGVSGTGIRLHQEPQLGVSIAWDGGVPPLHEMTPSTLWLAITVGSLCSGACRISYFFWPFPSFGTGPSNTNKSLGALWR